MGVEPEPEPAQWQSPFARTQYSAAPYPPPPHGPIPPSNSLGGSSINSFTGLSPQNSERVDRIQSILSKKLGPEYLSTRQGGGGTKLTYIEGWRVINLANDIFGYNGWYTEIKEINIDFVDFNEETKRYCMGVSAIVRVRLQDGASHEDVGYGKLENTKSKADGLDKCKKEAVTDALKRTLRNFGSLLGNCLYDKQYTAEVGKMKAQKV
ncbi:Rad52/22 family double-strand break repair protein-domain-containing protein, partial [Leucosporidium creatinivorum]